MNLLRRLETSHINICKNIVCLVQGSCSEHKAKFLLLLHNSIIIATIFKFPQYLWDLTYFSFSRTTEGGVINSRKHSRFLNLLVTYF